MNLIRFVGDEALSRTSVYRWFTQFNRGGSSLNDEFREGSPKSVVVPKNIDAVHELKLQDRHATYRVIVAALGIIGTSIHSILHEYLGVKKIYSRWITHNLTIAKKRLVLTGRKKCSKNTIAVLKKM